VATASCASHLARTLSARGIPTSVAVGDDLGGSEATERLLFRAAQEALRNAAAHSGASHDRLRNLIERTSRLANRPARARPDAWSLLSKSLALIRGRCPLSSWLSGKPQHVVTDPNFSTRTGIGSGRRASRLPRDALTRTRSTSAVSVIGYASQRPHLFPTATLPQEQDSRAGCPFGDRGEASASNKVGEASRCGRWVEQAVDGRVRDDGAGLARITLIPVSVGWRVCCSEPGGGGFE
jgi:hypothetical protein